MLRGVLLALIALLGATTPTASAGAAFLSMRDAERAAITYARHDVAAGQASGYELGTCTRRDRRKVWCWLAEYDVPVADVEREMDAIYMRVWIRRRGEWLTGVDDVFDTPERRLLPRR